MLSDSFILACRNGIFIYLFFILFTFDCASSVERQSRENKKSVTDEGSFADFFEYDQPYYYDKTIEKARLFAVEKLPELSEESRHAVKFTTPTIFQRRLFSRAGKKADSRRDIVETNIVWQMPEDPEKTIVVFGMGTKRLYDWYPLRAVIKIKDKQEILTEETEESK